MICVDTLHKVIIIAMVGKIGNPPFDRPAPQIIWGGSMPRVDTFRVALPHLGISPARAGRRLHQSPRLLNVALADPARAVALLNG